MNGLLIIQQEIKPGYLQKCSRDELYVLISLRHQPTPKISCKLGAALVGIASGSAQSVERADEKGIR